MPKFRSCRLNGVATIAITDNKEPGQFWPKILPVNFCLPPVDLCAKTMSNFTEMDVFN